MFTLSSIKIGMKYQDVRNEIIKSKISLWGVYRLLVIVTIM